MPPLGLFVHGVLRDRAQRPDRFAIRTDAAGRDPRARRLIHERHELVRESGHGAAYANAPDVRTTPNPSHPSALGNVAIDHRTPASDFSNALRRAAAFG